MPAAILALTLLGSFGWLAPRLGFYHDDWGYLEYFARASTYWGRVLLLAETNDFWSRPVALLQMPLFFTLGGLRPGVYQALQLTLQWAEGWLLFLLLKDLWRDRALALASACLILAIPNRGVHHFWYAASLQNAALPLAAASLLLHGRARELGSRTRLWGAQALYLLGSLTYESVVFLPLLRAGAIVGGRLPKGPRAALRDAARDLAPYGTSLALTIAWQLAGIPWLLHTNSQKLRGADLSLRHLASHGLKVYAAAFECVSNRVLHVCWLGAEAALSWGPLPLLAGAAFSLSLAWALSRGSSARAAAGPVWGAVAGAFLGAYAPYALSGSYMPQVFGIMSRTNGAGAWAGGMLAAAALAAAPRRRGARAALAAVVWVGFTAANWKTGLDWAESWSLQQAVLKKVSARVAGLPRGSTVLLADAPRFVGAAPLFLTDYDFQGALRLAAGRPDLKADASPPEEAVRSAAGRPDVYRYRYGADRMERLGG